MIVFKKLRYKNFLSTGNQFIEIELNKAHSTLVVGTNGSGKTTLLDALCFVLFNRPFRDIKKEQIVNTINQGDCMVEVEFTVGTRDFKIIRGIKPNVFEIWSEGKLLNQEASSVDYQKYLEQNIIKLNFRSFTQVVILGSSSYEPFMKMRARYRREVVEEILDIKVFGKMDQILRSKQADLQKNLMEVRHQCDLMKTRYQSEAKHLTSLQTQGRDFHKGMRSKLAQNEGDLKHYEQEIENKQKEIEELKPGVANADKSNAMLNKLSKLQTTIENKLGNHKKTLNFFEDNDTCPVCTQNIDKEFKSNKCQHENKQITKLEIGLKELEEEITKTHSQINAENKTKDEIQQIEFDIAKVNVSIDSIKKHSKDIEDEIATFKNKDIETTAIEKELNELKDELEKVEKDFEKINLDKKYVDILREIVHDKGAKTQIIKKYLPIMNSLINKYLQAMDFFISFHLDEEFNETVKSRFRDNFNYNNFSEGEKMRIDLALLFTWRGIAKMKNSVNTNLLILDEIFDSSLDTQGTDDFFKILKEFSRENIFIISHKGDILFDKFTNIIKFKKEHNFSALENA